ncbi:ABC transporter permease subunit [Streptomyces sp. MS1.AVA.1]|uniref:ABC transporter permease subunit n=1 Tax=Streptomyces machairae TaxID=3134109 RepID=A0ABU8UV58_9ACTN
MAAAIDGAGTWRTFWKVTFPLMAPVSVAAVIIRLIEASKLSDSVYVLTSGGPGPPRRPRVTTSTSRGSAISRPATAGRCP